jgi:hypothetical protein
MNCSVCGIETKGSLCSACRYDLALEKQREDRWQLRLAMVRAYGGKCQCPGGCDVIEPKFLCPDHIGNDGASHRKQVGGAGVQVWKDLEARGWPKDKYRLLCYNCNMTRNFYGACPHVKKANFDSHL